MHSSGDHGRDLAEHVGAEIVASAGRREVAEGVGSSMTVDITDTGAAGAQAAGPAFTPGRSSSMRASCGARAIRTEPS
jgi:hypothetical protein